MKLPFQKTLRAKCASTTLRLLLCTTSTIFLLVGCAADKSEHRTESASRSSSKLGSGELPSSAGENGRRISSTSNDESSTSRSKSVEARVEGWWHPLWRQQQQNALQCWRSARCSAHASRLPEPSALQDVLDLKESRTRRRAAQVILRANFLSTLEKDKGSLEQLTFRDGDAIFLLEDLAQLLTEHSAKDTSTLLAHAEAALRKRHESFDLCRRQKALNEKAPYASWTHTACGAAPGVLRNWALEILKGTVALDTSQVKKTEEILALLRGQALHHPHSTSGFLVADGRPQELGIPRCFLGDVSATTVRVGLSGAVQKEMQLLNASAKAQCRAGRRGESSRWAMAMGSIVERQRLSERARSWQVRLLAASVLALGDERPLHDAAEFWSKDALFHDDTRRGTSYWLSLAPSGETEVAFFAAVLGGAVDHIMAVRHGSAWAAKKGRDDVEKTLSNLELVFSQQGIEGVFRVAGEKEASAALLLTRL
ncbi:MAG: hypothetical protein GY822_03045 [Deltaproteobacteria bacterium]|nr:hypothetical protein [Deltaproteobacteria bacterium]